MRRDCRSGHAVVETALMAPWLFLLFVAVLDLGFYAYAGIVTANAARVAALYTASGSVPASACGYALEEMRSLPGVTPAMNTCAALPVQVEACSTGGGCSFACAADPADGASSSCVKVTYRTLPLFPIPGLVGQLTINRIAKMRKKVN